MLAVAVLTDVHADLPALESIFEAVDDAGITSIWCLGDFCSGGPDPVACYELVMDRCDVVLAGNHELFVVARIWEHFDAWWAVAARQAHGELGAERIAALRNLSSHVRIEGQGLPGVTLVHAALTDPVDHFIRKPAEATVNLQLLETPLLLYGHSHIPACWVESDGLAVSDPVKPDAPRPLGAARQLINPGAACDGQGARWLEWRFADDAVVWRQTGVRGHGARWRPP